MKISKFGFWEGEDVVQFHYHDPKLLEDLVLFCKEQEIKSVLDLGCGKGDYIKALHKEGLSTFAVDGNPNTKEITDGHGETLELHIDVTSKLHQVDLILSLEVGEHIPKKFEDTFINNITSLSNEWLILSWAVTNQAGHGHVNCQSNEYIINKIKEKGFNYSTSLSLFFRERCEFDWFKNTIMVFKKMAI